MQYSFDSYSDVRKVRTKNARLSLTNKMFIFHTAGMKPKA